MTKVMFSFSDNLVLRMKAVIPARERSKVLAKLLEQEIKTREQRLYNIAKELEESKGLKKEMTIWDSEFNEDGLKDV